MKKTIFDYLKIIMLIHSCINSSHVTAQQANLSRELLTFPVSPEAARLGTYGNVPVNLFTGRLNKSIELFNAKIGDYNLPLTLSYSYSGNRVEESPSIMGLGWQLNAGGVVTREVRGLPDSYNNNYYNFRTTNIGNKLFNLNKISNREAEKVINGFYDTEPDRYNVNVNGINFAFKIGLNGLPMFLSKHNYKIEIIRSDANPNQIIKFIMTDTKSNKYYFEDIETNEQISGAAYHDPYSFYDVMHPLYTSSWQLTKIETANSSIILYNYQNDDFNNYQFYASGTYNAYFQDPCSRTNNLYSSGCNKFLIKRKLLTSITNELVTINFNITSINGVKVYSEINVQNSNEIVKYNFAYQGARNYLIRINKNNLFYEGYSYNGEVDSFVDSEFDDVRNQDWWGFDNGVNTNNYMVNVPNSSVQTNRSPNFSNTLKGALTQIEYPTKGTTSIFYEQNKRASTNSEPNILINLKFKTDNDLSASAYKEKIITKTFDTDVIASLSHSISDKNHIDLKIIKVGTNTTSLNYFTDIPSLRNSWNPTPTYTPNYIFYAQGDGCTSYNDNCPAPCNCTESENSSGLFKLQAGTYMFKISSDYNRLFDATGEITLSFYDSTYPSFFYENIGGVHVSRTVDFDGVYNKTNYYDYNEQNDIPTESINRSLDNAERYEHIHSYLSQLTGGSITCNGCGNEEVIGFNSSSFNLFLNGSPKTYTEVIESNNQTDIVTPIENITCTNCGYLHPSNRNYDNTKIYSYIGNNLFTTKRIYPNGFKKYKYYPSSDGSAVRIPGSHDLSIGRIESEEVFSPNSVSSESVALSEKKYDYLMQTGSIILNDPSYPRSLKIIRKRMYTGCSITNDLFEVERSIYNNEFYEFHDYNDTDIEYLTESIYTKETFENQSAIEQTTNITYDSHNQQKTITKSDSNNNILTNELFYPYDFADNTSLEMVSKNYISPIVKVVNKKNGNIIDSYKYDFTIIGWNLFKPSLFWKSKGNGVLEKLSAYSYDSKGNVSFIQNIESETQVPPHTVTNGPTTTIIWGYNDSQPIAKIENLASFPISQTLINDAKDKSNTGTEAELIVALNAIRSSLPNAMVTTYTHIPLVGVSTMTDPKGDTITYTYDSFNRLKEVKDKNGNKLSENEYHYRPQN
jgi:YD repeat-containing protein